MSASDFLTNISIILGLMAAITAVEAVVPLFSASAERQGRRVANLGLTAMTFVVNWGFMSAAAVLTLAQGPGVLSRLGLWLPLELIVSIAILDFFFGYLAHRALHAVPWLWRVHAVHHSDPFVDVTTSYRSHPIETAWRAAFMMVPVWILSIQPSALVLYRMLSAINALLEHANLRVWPRFDQLLSCIWVTPNMHKVHHSRARAETNSNYGNLLSIYDRVLGTFIPTSRAASVVYGLDDTDPRAVRSLTALMSMRVRQPPRFEREPAAKTSAVPTA
jgi:sterol desaturase/sphingolipid hydroxylase (fatty acid hydroxylase superfamily)